MLWVMRWVAWAVLRGVLSLRYRLTLRGLDDVLQHPGPYLILPNHPAYCDPPNLLVRLWPIFQVRPLLLETNFQNPLLAPIAWLLRGIRMPDIVKASAADRRRAEEAVGEVIAALRAGDNVILWPSGRLSRDGSEKLGGARTAADVLAAVPHCTVVLARTRGLYGSMTSWADGPPRLLPVIARAFALWVANLFVFAPRRSATVTLEAFLPHQRPEPTRAAVNRWLEAWYNADTPREEPTFVPRHFLFGPRTHIYPPPLSTTPAFDFHRIPPETKTEVADIVAAKRQQPLTDEENQPDTTFVQLGLDSLDAMDVTLTVEQRFGFRGDEVPTTLGGLWALAAGWVHNTPPPPPPAGWFAPPTDQAPLEIRGETIGEAFLQQALARKKQLIVADDIAGGVTYERLLVGMWLLGERLSHWPAAHLGLLLPASVGCDLAFLALLAAGKVPVVLNWTTGPSHLVHAVQLLQLTHVVTSKAFIDRTHIHVPGVQYIFLEDLRASFGKFLLLRRVLAVRWFGRRVYQQLRHRMERDPHRPAVVLFTSGSEKAPKAVPLTHANILADQRAAIAALKVDRHNSTLSFLPMFHSFGLTVTGLLPLLVGVKVVHHPDPTDARTLARKIAAYRVTLIAGTPTFISAIFDRAQPGELDSLRIIVVGAEKAPPTLFAKAQRMAPQAEVLEGYGVTECSPVVAVNRPGAVRPGTVGWPLPGVEVCVTDVETHAVLPRGQMGMLHVAGPIVFPGYLGHDGPPPFTIIDGKTWYTTGDLATLDDTGAIIVNGRLKRFLKAGGEMISLPALEEPFTRLYPPTDQGPRVAVEGVETPSGRRIVLFSTEPLNLRDANAILQAAGFHGLMRLDEVRLMEKIPTLGSGKTDYKTLRSLIEGR
ncbi:MAG: AMP-binding protein [Gemmataceae bacterium]|nr:AMP-binding protein [Gemmata sp.]MDW8198336.1 AMP-binding protein [Gemmataceae bacterium]